MYKVYYNGALIHDPSLMSPDYILLEGKCSKEAGKVDTMDFTILPNHPFYNVFTKLQTGIVAYRDDVEIFRGRILSSTVNMNGEKSVQCEGSLAYLLDSVQPIMKVDGTVSCANLFRTIIANHNNQVEAAKQFQVGIISAAKASDQIEVNQTSYTETRSMIDSYLLNPKGGYLRARFENNVQYIDWIEDFGRNPNQPFVIGANIVEMSEENSTDDFYTILLPLGKEEAQEKETREDIEEDEARDHTVFVSDVNGGSPYMPVSNEFVQAYGRIYHIEDYGTVSSPTELKSLANDTLAQYRKKLNRTVEITGLDLHFLDPNYDQILIGDRVNIIAPNFNKNETLVATKIDYDFNKPQGDRYSFGDGILPLTRKTEAGISTTKKTAEKAKDNSLTNGRDLLIKKNLIDIEANKLNLRVNDAMNITAKYVKWTFDAMAFGGNEYSYSPADRQRIRGELADRWTSITRSMEGYISPEQGLADFKAISKIASDVAEQTNKIYMHLDSDQGLFNWGVESKNLTDLSSTMNDVQLVLNGPDGTGGLVSQVYDMDRASRERGELLREAGIYVNPDTGAWLFNTDYTTGLGSVIKAERDKASMVVTTNPDGTYAVNVGEIILAINEAGQSVGKINANKVLLSAGSIEQPLDTYMLMQSGKIDIVVGTDSQGRYVVNPAAIVASINDQTGESQVKLNADKVVITAGGKTENLDTYIRNQLGKIELVVNTDSQGRSAINPASIVMAINDQSGQSQIKLNADQIDMDGLVSNLRTKSLNVSSLSVTGAITSSNGSLTMPTIYLGTTESRKSLATALEDVQIVQEGTNIYRLQKKTFGVNNWQNCDITFSRATTLARSWSGGTVTVTATPQGNKLKMGIYSPTTDELTWNGNKVSFEVKTNLDDNAVRYPTGKIIEIDAQAIYDAGKRDGSGTTLSRTWSGGTVTVTASPQGNTLRMGIYDLRSGDISWNGNEASLTLYTNLDGNEQYYPTGKTLKVDASARYTAGYNSARLSLDTSNHKVYISQSGSSRELTVSTSGTIGEFNGAEMAYPVSIFAKVNNIALASDTVWVPCEPEGAYSNGWNDGYDYGISQGGGSSGDKLILDTQTGVISIGTTGSVSSAAVTVHAVDNGWDSVHQWSNITISARVGGVTMASATIHVLGPNG